MRKPVCGRGDVCNYVGRKKEKGENHSVPLSENDRQPESANFLSVRALSPRRPAQLRGGRLQREREVKRSRGRRKGVRYNTPAGPLGPRSIACANSQSQVRDIERQRKVHADCFVDECFSWCVKRALFYRLDSHATPLFDGGGCGRGSAPPPRPLSGKFAAAM